MMEFDYCDKCGPSIRAYVYAEMSSGLPLTYCGHCGTLYWNGIIEQGGKITHDLKYLITA